MVLFGEGGGVDKTPAVGAQAIEWEVVVIVDMFVLYYL